MKKLHTLMMPLAILNFAISVYSMDTKNIIPITPQYAYKQISEFTAQAQLEDTKRNSNNDVCKKHEKLTNSINFWQKFSGLGSEYFITNHRVHPNYFKATLGLAGETQKHYPKYQVADNSSITKVSPDHNQYLERAATIIRYAKRNNNRQLENLEQAIAQAEQENLRWKMQGIATVAAVATAAGAGLYLLTKNQK